jgi:hypothetical protein
MNAMQGRFWTLAALAVLVTACGGSGSGGDDDSGSQPPTSAARTVFVTGAITGFGSVLVNGVRYDTESAEVRIEDRPGSALELQVGEVVRMKAEIDGGGVARARSIDQDHLIQGPVQAIDLASGTITVSGQAVTVDADTLFDDSIPTRSLAGIGVGDVIEIHGFASADGARATRVERAGAGETEVEVTGLITNLDAAALRFHVGALVVDYSGATLDDFGAAGLAAGQLVEVKGASFLPDGALAATRVEREDHDFDGRSGDGSEVEGLVTRFASATDFDVAGQRIITNGSTRFEGGSAADLALDVKVEVEGSLDATATLVASKVAFKRRSSLRLAGPVESVDAAAGTFVALGITVMVSPSTLREDHEGDDHFFGLDDLRPGDWVEVGGFAEVGTSRLVATRLERDDAEDEVEMRGPATEVGPAGLKVFGIPVQLTSGTDYEDEDQPIGADEFLARAPGSIVEADGIWTGSAIVADEVEIER